MTSRIRTYSELSRIDDFVERYRYLQLRGAVGDTTFGFDRHINQMFYTSTEWRKVRNAVIARDFGCDLGVEGFEINDPRGIHVHHMNPMVADNIIHGEGHILDPEFLISTSQRTHNAIHFGDERLLPRQLVERMAGDTQLW